MNMTTNRMSPVTSISTTCETEQDIKNWSQYSQGIAAAMSKRMAELGLTDACRKNELHPTIHLQSIEREKEHVAGNHM